MQFGQIFCIATNTSLSVVAVEVQLLLLAVSVKSDRRHIEQCAEQCAEPCVEPCVEHAAHIITLTYSHTPPRFVHPSVPLHLQHGLASPDFYFSYIMGHLENSHVGEFNQFFFCYSPLPILKFVMPNPK